MSKIPGNKSLFVYTGLIFIVALIIIILTFFGQDRILKETNEQIETATAGITERATILSDENMKLSEKVIDLEAQIKELNETNKSHTEKENAYELITEIYFLIRTGDIDWAKAEFDLIDPSLLSGNTLAFYNELKETLKNLPEASPSASENIEASPTAPISASEPEKTSN
ncbi:MAG: hypothetical protein J1F64_03440 [Oscillospiraceae bacterium]|nr:hypothetical protein [Oscillospiraceae bacterium]